jgi:hypothetical protein
MLDVKNRLGNHVFHQALVESDSAYVWLLTKKDGTSPVLVYWSPQHTTDANVNANIPLQLMIDWSAALPTHYTLDSTLAYPFAHMSEAEPGYLAATPLGCGSAKLNVIRRMPAIIPLKSCNACVPVSSAGSITAPVTASGNTPFDPTPIQNLQAANSSNNAPVQYQWQESSDNVVFVDIENATGLTYDPPALIKTTYFRRGARAAFCDIFQYTPSVTISVAQGCATVAGFVRTPQTLTGCNPDGEYSYELTLSQVVAPETVIFDGLPLNGLVAAHSSLNDLPIPPGNLQLAGSGKLTWLVSPSNGLVQRLKLGYCNVLQYPEPVFATAATTSCSGTITTCSEDSGRMGERQTHGHAAADFTITPNPGRERVQILLEGASVVQEVRCFNATGQLVLTSPGGHDRAATLDTRALLPGMYFIWVSTDGIWQQRVWVKQ